MSQKERATGALLTLLKPPPLLVPKERRLPQHLARSPLSVAGKLDRVGTRRLEDLKCITLHSLTGDCDLGQTHPFSFLLS